MGRVHWDTDQADRLSIDLRKAPGRMQRSAPKVFNVAANKIKRGMKLVASGHDYLPSLDQHVSYTRLDPLVFEIGFDKVGQGNLANIAAFGSVNNAPVMDHTAPLRAELPSLIRYLGDEGEDAVLGGDR